MIHTEKFKNKDVVVVGLGRSGLACANLLYDLSADVSVTDNRDSEATRANALKLKSKSIKIELGTHTREFIKGKDLVIISPGVPNDAPPVIWAKEYSIPVISEIEFAWNLCPGTVIAVTGTSGKTTVTTLIAKMLELRGFPVVICGNIGNPFSGEVEKIREGDYVSLEVSSFQLQNIIEFKPKISVMLNFSYNHLDRHKDMQEYLDAKKRIFANQDRTDYLVLNQDDPVLKGLAKEANAQVVYFSQTKELNPNQAAVICVGAILGIDKDLVLRVFREFKGIEHRMEFVAEINQIKFVNDSKATTADSALWALRNIPEPIILIAGGKDKGVDYSLIMDLGRKKIKQVFLIGEAKGKISRAIGNSFPVEDADTLEEAVSLAFQKASPGDCVLLSPMCSSFDMFSSYEERGGAFKKAVYGLAKSKG